MLVMLINPRSTLFPSFRVTPALRGTTDPASQTNVTNSTIMYREHANVHQPGSTPNHLSARQLGEPTQRAAFLRGKRTDRPDRYVRHEMGLAGRLGQEAQKAREEAKVDAIVIAQAAHVSEATISRFESGRDTSGTRSYKLTPATERIVRAYEDECGLERGELWRRAIG